MSGSFSLTAAVVAFAVLVISSVLGGLSLSPERFIARKSRLREAGVELDGPQRRALMTGGR